MTEKLERITIYLTLQEKMDLKVAAAQLSLTMATLGRTAVQYFIYTPKETVNEIGNDDSQYQESNGSV